ncbi:uncharacterized protein LOC126973006 [Leptidea sinapis]|uniref:uncharacterized protein LOC126973006 n=1 Tax=Leptidea sinapis TaxID=189913 RepID=UPI002136B1EB|nr:uncharacterized protein LOC126973006 [Leptidea sinapis]
MEVKNKRLFGAVEVTEPRAPAGDPYRMRQRPLTVDELAELAAHLHIAHLTELQRLRDFQRRYQWPAAQDQGYGKPRHQIIRMSSRLEQGAPTLATWRPVVLPRNLKELFDTVPKAESREESDAVWRATRGWAAGLLLLVVALFLVRATDRFFAGSYWRWRRSRSEEWPTPNVLATSNHSETAHELDQMPAASGTNLEMFSELPPPPYSSCGDLGNLHVLRDHDKDIYEEPPPPYSACFVQFNNPKDGVPSVHIHNTQSANILEDQEAASTSSQAGSGRSEHTTNQVNPGTGGGETHCGASSSRTSQPESQRVC